MELKKRLTFANVCSASALAIVLGVGSANAAGMIGPGQIQNGAVTTPKLAKHAVTTPKIAPNAVTSDQVKPHSLGANVFAPGVLRSKVIDVPYTAELTTASPQQELTYPIPAGSWLVSTTVAIASSAGPTGNQPKVSCQGPRSRDGVRPVVLIDINIENWVNTWQVTTPLESDGTSPETTIWSCTLTGPNSAANVKVTTLMQRVGGFE